MFHTADPEDVLNGSITDVYFQRSLRILEEKRINPNVKAEFFAKGLPEGWPWAVFAGLEEAMYLMGKLNIKVRALREGTVFHPGDPVMEIEGRYRDFCVFETALLGLICQATGIATKSARFKALAGKRPVLSFGARRMHPVLAPMIERNAYVGGCDGVSVIKSGELIGENPMGTMPHALILCMGSTVEAIKAYDEVMEPDVKRVVLIDTFQDEKFECIDVAEAMGKRLYAIRFDTPASRRGDFKKILDECRWELDTRGHGHIKFFVSGGIKEDDIVTLNPVVDGYGIGTAISDAPVVDYSMDIIEIEGVAYSKRGKLSGSKRLLRCECGERKLTQNNRKKYRCQCGKPFKDLLSPVLKNGDVLTRPESPTSIRKRTLREIGRLMNGTCF
jgi:nicotinate phosphoribosyltransferase